MILYGIIRYNRMLIVKLVTYINSTTKLLMSKNGKIENKKNLRQLLFSDVKSGNLLSIDMEI